MEIKIAAESLSVEPHLIFLCKTSRETLLASSGVNVSSVSLSMTFNDMYLMCVHVSFISE